MRSSGGFGTTLELVPDEAASLVATVTAAACGLAGVLLADVPAATSAGLALAVAAGTAVTCLHRRRRGGRPVRALRTPHGWRLFVHGDESPRDAALVAAWGGRHGPVVALRWRETGAGGRQHWAWFTRRTVGPDAWRRLRVRLHLS